MSGPTIDLTDAEKRDLIALIQAGKPLPENQWQSFRTRQDRALERKTAPYVYARPGCYQVTVKVIDIFGNDTMTLLPVIVG
jgi:site-specific DNA-methyltransferase (adenine-specific)/adenine-specific DNA-methyltransferase